MCVSGQDVEKKNLIRSEYTMKDRKDETLNGVYSKELVETAITCHFPTFIMSFLFFYFTASWQSCPCALQTVLQSAWEPST